MTADMKRSWLVQRLMRPRAPHPMLGKDNPFSFGGGLRNGGLSPHAMDILRSIWAFDYMGSAEFEWGAVPEALQGMAKRHDRLTAFTLDIDLESVPPNWRDRSGQTPEGVALVYVICDAEHAATVSSRIADWARGDENLKDFTRLTAALRPYNDWDSDLAGWLELDNGFLFFTDELMWQRAGALFGLTIEAAAAR